ncbi:MAG: hypothetical protein ABR586_07530 [Thermoplasmatota archaeon]
MTYAHERAFRKVQRSRRLGETPREARKRTPSPEGAKAAKLSLAQLQYINAHRRPQAILLDLMMSHTKTIMPGDPRVATWIAHPGRYDVQDVDTPGSTIPFMHRHSNASFRLDPLAGKLLVFKLKGPKGKTPSAWKKRRDENLKALIERQDALGKEMAGVEDRLKGELEAADRRRLKRDEGELKLAIKNAAQQRRAFEDGDFLVMGKAEDRKLLLDYVKVLETSFKWKPRTFDVPAVLVGRTREAGVGGYTHAVKSGTYRVPYIAVNDRIYDHDYAAKIQSPEGRKRRLAMIHEAVHVAREDEAGRTVEETRHVKDYGKDKAREEKHTMLESDLRAGSENFRKGEAYYGFIEDAPEQAGAEDNKITLRSKRPRIVRDLTTMNRKMKRNAKKTHIERLEFQSGKWKGRKPENVDRVLRAKNGDEVQVFNDKGAPKKNMAAFVDRLEATPGQPVREYDEGHLKPVRDRPKRRRLP